MNEQLARVRDFDDTDTLKAVIVAACIDFERESAELNEHVPTVTDTEIRRIVDLYFDALVDGTTTLSRETQIVDIPQDILDWKNDLGDKLPDEAWRDK